MSLSGQVRLTRHALIVKSLFTAMAVVGLICCSVGNSPARDATWVGGSTDAKWENGGNWSDNQIPATGDALIFSGATGGSARNGKSNLMISGITFSADAGTFGVNGKPIKLRGDITNLSGNPQTLNLYITLMKSVVISATGDLAVGGVIRGEKFGLDKTGPGQLTLTGACEFKGPTTVHSGTLVLGNDKALGASSSVSLEGGNLSVGNNISPTTGALKVVSPAILDFGAASGSHVVTFADSKAQPWTGTLSIYNWDGDATASNSLAFGTDNTALTAAQLKAITFYRDDGKMLLGTAAWGSNNGKLTFTPAR